MGLNSRVTRFLRGAIANDRETRIASSGYFDAEDIDWICATYFEQGTGPGSTWQRCLRDAHMRLPKWYQHGLDPLGLAYAEQQQRLWKLVAGVHRGYEASVDEKEHSWGDIDPVRFPGFFVRRDAGAVATASDHVLASGMLLKHSGLSPGDWALEYGAGFGHTALTLARLGVNVDTIDISDTFCDYIRQQAEFFKVPLTPFHGVFGTNPRPGQKYALIWFYESFHHCLDFQNVVRVLREHLAEGGRIVLGGEPIVEREYAAVPYPWGVRLHSEVAAVMRRQHWFELGFSEVFLFELFTASGFTLQRIECEPSPFGRLYVAERRTNVIELAKQWMPTLAVTQWSQPDEKGRMLLGEATLTVDAVGEFNAIDVTLANVAFRSQRVNVEYGGSLHQVQLPARQGHTMRLPRVEGATTVRLQCPSKPFMGMIRLIGAALGRLRHAKNLPGHSGVRVERIAYVVNGA